MPFFGILPEGYPYCRFPYARGVATQVNTRVWRPVGPSAGDKKPRALLAVANKARGKA
jgi:hypothetical protein